MILGEVFPGEDAEVLVEAIKNDFSGEDEDTIQDLVVWVKHYKETEVQATGATAVWNSNMGQYLITIPSAYVPTSGIFDVCVKGSDIDDILIRLQVNTADSIISTLATSAELVSIGLDVVAVKLVTDTLSLAAINAQVDTAISDAATANTIATPTNVASALNTYDAPTKAEMDAAFTQIKGATWSNETLTAIKAGQLTEAQVNAQCDSALGDYDAPTKAEMDAAIALVSSVGAEKVIPPDYYTLNATAKTITLTSPYNTLTVEQIKFIKDIDANYIIYDDREKSYEELPISITDGVITYTAPAANTENGNAIQISINM